MTNAEKLTLAKHACHIRMGVIEGTHSAKCGHPGGSLDIAEVLSYLYFVDMNVDPENPKAPDRDRLVLSKGHAAPGLYAALAERGYFPVEDLKTLRKIGSYLQGHPNMNTVPGVDMSTGSLGQASPPPAAWHWVPSSSSSPSASTPLWATARWKRASAGRRSCLRPTTSSPTSASSWTATICRSTAPPRRSWTATRWKKSSRLSISTF